jgi:multidrug efflux system membrane fusion protein
MRLKTVVIILGLIASGAAAAYYFYPAEPVGGASERGNARLSGSSRFRNADADQPIPVVAGTVEIADVPVYLTGIGTVTAFNTVSVKSRIDGQLQQVMYTEGQDVRAGEVLAQIDPRPLQAALRQMEAAKLKDAAQLISAKADLARYQALSAKEYATKQSVEQQKATVAQLDATLQSDEAQIDSARVQLEYTTITSPINGRTGLRQVDAGNIVHPTDQTPLVVVTQVQPISVVFTLPSDVLPQITQNGASTALPVAAFSKDNQQKLADGTLSLIDNMIDQTTGTIKLKAVFANEQRTLWPGQFVNARLLATTRKGGLLIPATVAQRGPNGNFAFVIKSDLTVEMRPIEIGPVTDGRALVVSGLAAGERVVVDGQYKLQAGSKVEISQSPPGPAPNSHGAETSPDAAPAISQGVTPRTPPNPT